MAERFVNEPESFRQLNSLVYRLKRAEVVRERVDSRKVAVALGSR
jgi:hypothetical protein